MSRRTKWHPAPPTPKILHFPRRRSRKLRHGFAAEKWLSQDRELASNKQRLKLERPLTPGRIVSKRSAVLEEEIQGLTHKLHFNLRIKPNTNILKQTSLSDSTNHVEEDEARRQENKCSGRCKAVVLRIVEQVRAETEQWSQMQTMLEQVRGEMEELQASRDYWENRAYTSEFQIQSLRHSVEEWKQKAVDYKKEVHELENKVAMKMEAENDKKRGVPLLSLAKQLAKEKRSFLKEKASRRHSSISDRSPLREIGNSRQNHRAAFDYHSPERSRIRESFRK
ncbi:hypothetical protein SASPL_103388 [Salvia splendens]|uniref:Uncharacterized protein n=1 Tax=Salvia splendens TaxID=180675 RepID=A0A8X8YVJ4_SALSN|nr:uncharacterized protein LOC121756907 [Salvia splendens]KAG6438445.1 hypothetical protein SASPL_103388 [Salvia splendens]